MTVSAQTATKDMCPLVTCQSHCGDHVPVKRGGCFCDPACPLHGDCCHDYMVVCREDNTTRLTSEHILAVSDLFRNSMECLDIKENNGRSYPYKVVVRCPAGATEWTRALCEDVDDPHISQVVPVVDEDHQMIYRNWYCASCHNATSPTVLNPKFDSCSVHTDILIDAFLSNGTEALNAMLVKFCKMLVPTDLITIQSIRTDCRKGAKVQKWCNEDLNANLTTEYEVLETLCKSYQSVVLTYIGKVYKLYSNMFCAQCSGVQTEDLMCLDFYRGSHLRPDYGLAFPSFSVMLDFTNGQTAPSVQAKFEDEPLCENSTVIDKFAAVCVADTCPHNHVPFHDGCAELPPPLANYTVFTITFEFSDLVGLEEFNKTFPTSTVHTAIEKAFGLDLIVFEWALCPNDSLSHVCAVYQGRSISHTLPWNRLIDKSDWESVYDPIVGLSLPLTNITITNYELEGLQCENGSRIIWMENPTVLSTDLKRDSTPNSLYVYDRTTKVSLSMTAVAISLRLDKIGQRTTGIGFKMKTKILWSTSMKSGHCHIPIIDCVDKVEIAPEKYTVFAEDTGIVVEIAGTNVSVKVGEYLFSAAGVKEDHGLVVCGGSLPKLLPQMAALPSIHEVVQGYVTLGTLILSIGCLIATICTHVICSELRTVPGHITVQLCLALLCAQLLFLTNKLFVAYRRTCRALAVLQHVTWLAAFCWMNVFALDVCNSFLKMKEAGSGREKKRLVLYGLYSWGAPCLFTLGWILAQEYQLIPIIYGGNELTTVMGLPWACGFLANIGPLWPLWYVFIVLNASQGVFIFVTFMCKRRIFRMLKSTIQQSSYQPGHGGSSQPPKQAKEDGCSSEPSPNDGGGKMSSSKSTDSSNAGSSPGVSGDVNPLPEWNAQPSKGSIESGYISTRM